MSPSPEALGALAQKYETLGELRRARAAGAAVPPAAVFRALAKRFPGCLVELDTLPIGTIEARATMLRDAADGGPREPWMSWLHDYHALLRAALLLKPRVRRGVGLDAARADALARRASADAGVTVDVAFVHAVANPPAGRLVTVVLARIEATYGEPRDVIKAAILPRPARAPR